MQTQTKGFSVSGKMALGAMALVLASTVVTSFFAINNQTDALIDAEERSAKLLAAAVVTMSREDLMSGNIASLTQTIRGLRAANPALLWIAVKDKQGTVLARDPEQSAGGSDFVIRTSQIAISGETLGELQMIFDRAPIESAKREILETTLGVAAVLLIGALLASLSWARIFSRPIEDLAAAAGRVAGGDLAVRVSVAGRDEVGMLGAGFNDMVENLRKSRTDLERTLNELSTLYSVSRIINSTSDRDEILKLNIETLATGFKFSPVVILLEKDFQWHVAALHRDQETRSISGPDSVVTLGSLGLDAVIGGEGTVLASADRLPSAWGFREAGLTQAAGVALKSGSHVVGILLAGFPGDSSRDAEKILSVVASQIAPPILVTMMAEREMRKLSDPFTFISARVHEAVAKAESYGLGLSLLNFEFDPAVWKLGATEVEKRFEATAQSVRASVEEAELIVRLGANRLIAVVPGLSRKDARALLMKLELPHPDETVTSIISFPEDGRTGHQLLAACEKIAGN